MKFYKYTDLFSILHTQIILKNIPFSFFLTNKEKDILTLHTNTLRTSIEYKYEFY